MSEHDNIPEPLKKLMALERAKAAHQAALNEISSRQSDQIEHEVLVDLWRDLGDNTETYWQTINACAAFQEVHNTAVEVMAHLSPAVRGRVLRALGATFTIEASAMTEITAVDDETARKIAALS